MLSKIVTQMKKINILLSVVAFLLIMSSCEKEEGRGGTAKIVGNVWVKDYNADFTRLLNTYWAQDEDVFLMYGNDSIHSDKTETAYNGAFMFEYLQAGDYRVFVYSKDSTLTSSSGIVPIIIPITISDKDDDVVVPTINIFN
jgi:hypothetical protein